VRAAAAHARVLIIETLVPEAAVLS